MASWSYALAVAFWIFLPACADAAGAGWFRDRTCLTLTGQTPYPAALRRNVTVNGISGPLKIGYGNWEAGQLLAWLSKVLIEEVFGIHVEISPYTQSLFAFYALCGCQNPHDVSFEDAQCERDGPPHIHVALPQWKTVHGDNALAWTKQNRPAKYPIDLGEIGYKGQNGFIVQEGSTVPAMERDHLPLEYYRSFSHPRVDVSQYFSSMHDINSSDLTPCNRTLMVNSDDAKMFLRVTGDAAGMNAQGDAFKCTDDHWWVAPSCRADLSKCIPVISAGDGWGFQAIAQSAVQWKMPLAFASTKDYVTYTKLPKAVRAVTFWWYPDVTFLSLNPVWIAFPPHNPGDWANGVMTGSYPNSYIGKWAYSGMANRTNEGTDRILELMRNLRVSSQQITELMMAYIAKTQGAAGLEAAVCEWANNETSTWQSWIGVETNCLEGQGMVTASGAFVGNRTLATTCAWCPPGRMSVQLVQDADGITYRCEECPQGEYQEAIGMIRCDRCDPGTAAPSTGMASCTRCGLSEYVAVAGATQCDPCPQGFVTSFEGAQSVDACVCPAGKYRDGVNRDRCLDCEFGMVCPVGLDALGFLPEHSAQYPVAPELKPGFWSSAADPLSVFRCEDDVRCQGGRPGSVCFDRLEGRSCHHCASGFFWTGEGCQQCSQNTISYIVFPILPVIALPVLVIVLYRFTRDDYAHWGKWQNCLGAMLFLLLQHYHLMKVIYRTDTSLSEQARRAMNTFAWTSDLWSLVNLGCYGLKSFSRQMILQSLGPMFIFIGYLLVWGASQLVGRRFPAVKMDINRTMSGFFSIILTFFTGIADMALTVFKCAKNPNGQYSLVSDRSILCYTDEWNGLLAVGILSALVWCGGIMLVCIYAIYSAPMRFHDRAIQARWKFLFIRYRADVHWWALVIVVKSIIVNLGCVILSIGTAQITWILVTILIYVHVISCFRPWRSNLNNAFDIDIHLSLILACASIYMFAAQDENVAGVDNNILGEKLAEVVNYAPPVACLPFAFLIYMMTGSPWARSKKAENIEALIASIRMLPGDDAQLARFLRGLSEADWLVMAKAKDIIPTELGSRKARKGYSSKTFDGSSSFLDLNDVLSEATTSTAPATPAQFRWAGTAKDKVAAKEEEEESEEPENNQMEENDGEDNPCESCGEDMFRI